MPTPGQQAMHQPRDPALLKALEHHGAIRGDSGIAAELSALREEVAALRALLTPPSAVILTGVEAERAYARLRVSAPKTAAQMRYDASGA